MIFTTLIGFVIGLQATLHCVGMCGPLAFAAPIDRSRKSTAIWGSLSYNFGRVSSYTYLGFLLGLLGIGSTWIYTVQILSILSGLFFIATVLFGSMESWFGFRQLMAKIGQFNTRLFPVIKKMPHALRPFLFGVLNGFLPCGMVYLALIYALTSPNMMESVLSMFFFGLGTIPVMFFIPLIGQQRFDKLLAPKAQKVLLFIVGLILILRGLNLGLPYLSPSIQAPTAPNAQPSIECCDVQK
jgi:sulfite exporter TauE/SafE